MSTPNMRPGPMASQRRSQRILLAVPLQVSGMNTSGKPFSESAKTLIVNAHGALIQLRESVQLGQGLRVTNIKTGEEIACAVVDINTANHEIPEVGVEFAEQNARFWRVSFPPSDWSPRNPEAKRFANGSSYAPPPIKIPAPKK